MQIRTIRVFEVMHMENIIARFAMNGKAEIYNAEFMPYDLYLDEDTENDIDIISEKNYIRQSPL